MANKDNEKTHKGITRRGFIQVMGAGAVGSVATRGVSDAAITQIVEPGEMARIKLLSTVDAIASSLSPAARFSLFFVRNSG